MNFDEIEGAPTPGFKPLALFASLLPRLQELRSLAHAYSSPNPEDDLPARLAIVGFSFRAPTSEWSYSHFAHLQEYRDRELGPDLSSFYGDADSGDGERRFRRKVSIDSGHGERSSERSDGKPGGDVLLSRADCTGALRGVSRFPFSFRVSSQS